METSSKGSEIVYNKYYPQHPLPKEIQDLSTKETVCEFCGISYLIHSEIKRLEEEIISLNKKIKYFEELQISEGQYEIKYKNLIIQQNHDNLKYSSLQENFNLLKNERDLLHADITSKEDKIIKMESSLEILKNNKEKIASKQKNVFSQLFELTRKNSEFKNNILTVKNEISLLITNNQRRCEIECATINGTVDRLKDFYKSEIQQYQFDIRRMESDIILLKDDIKEKSQQHISEKETNKCLDEKYKKLLRDNNSLDHELREKMSIISEKDVQITLLNNEKEEIKRLKENDIHNWESQIEFLKEKNKKLEQSLIQEGISNNGYKVELENTRVQLKKISLNNSELSNRLSIYEDEIKILKNSIEKAADYKLSVDKENETIILKLKEELNNLKLELISSKHTDHEVKTKIQTEMKNQKSLYEEEINYLKTKIYYQSELQEKINEKEKELENILNTLHRLNDDNIQLRKNCEEMETSKKLEIISCNSEMIQELENEIMEKEKIIDRMEENLIRNKNEIYSLQQTIQKECEERHELTESLNRAREQLLIIGEFNITKSLVNLPPIQQRNSTSSIISSNSNSSQCSQKPPIFKKQHHTNSIISTKRKLERLFNT